MSRRDTSISAEAPRLGRDAWPVPPARAWAAWSVGGFFFFYAFVLRVSPSVMVEELMRDFAVGGALLGNLSAFYFYAYAGLQMPLGVLMDRLGPRRLMAGAAVLAAGGTLLFALADSITGAYLGRLLIGAGSACSWVGALTLATLMFPPARFALLGGLTQTAGTVGAIFGQAPLGAAVDAFGWRGAMTATALIGLILAILFWTVVEERPRHAATPSAFLGGFRRAAMNRETWLCAICGLAFTAPILAFAGLWGVPYLAAAYGMARPEAAAVLSFCFVGLGIGAPILGWLSDHLGRRKAPLIAAGALSTASLALILYLPSLPIWLICVLLCLNGAGTSALVLTFAAAREHNPPGVSGAAYGIVNTAVIGSGAVFQPLVGLLLDLQWQGEMLAGARVFTPESYRLAFASLLAACVLGLVAGSLMSETHGRQRG
ncbi:MAG: MFS transporter [Proteobacteria bacterium]|nr:MFS transporter [Pseudomonadota bacterium]MBI3498057.1 MFS transporter [Pseudomonadota bacterium]